MNKWFYLVFSICFTMLVTGCGENPYTSDIEELEKMKTRVEDASKEFKTLDSTSLPKISRKVFEDLRFVQRNYKPDTISMEEGMVINQYKDLRKRCAKYFMVKSRLTKNFPYTINQLNNIIHDLNEEVLSRDESEKYIEVEKKASAGLLDAYKMYKEGIPDVMRKFDSLQPHVNKLMQATADTLK